MRKPSWLNRHLQQKQKLKLKDFQPPLSKISSKIRKKLLPL